MRQRSSLDQFRESLRLQQVYNTMSRYGFDWLLDRGAVGEFRRQMQKFFYQPDQPVVSLSLPVKTRLMLQELGPTYVKMGQIISSRAEVLPPEWAEEMNKLQSDVPPFPSEEVREIIVDELGLPPEEIFEAFDPTPFAAASTAQVHDAYLQEGEHVVVKVQRPHIRQQVRADIGVMSNAASVTERRSSYARDMNLDGLINEFGDGIIRELDYGGELYNMKRLARNMNEVPGVVVPQAYSNLSTSKVLVMDFMEGVKITDVAAIDAAGLDRYAIGVTILRALIKQLLVDGFFHADPHPGNLMVNLDTGDVGFLDMGMMGEINLKQRLNLINLLLVVRQSDPAGLARAVRSLSVPFRKGVDDAAFYSDFERAIGRYMEPDAGASFGDLMGVVFDLLSAHGLRLDAELTLAIKAMMQAEAIYSVLHPEGGGLTEIGFDLTVEQLKEQATADNVKDILSKQAGILLQDLASELPSYQDATLSWLKQYRKGRFEVYVDLSDINREVNTLNNMMRQIILGIVIAGMIIGSSFAASFSATAGAGGTDLARWALWAYFGSFIFAAVFVVILVYKLIWGRDDREEEFE